MATDHTSIPSESFVQRIGAENGTLAFAAIRQEYNKGGLNEKGLSDEAEHPKYGGEYAVTPYRIEFWQRRANRLHDRFVYTLASDGSWDRERLAP